MGYDVVVVGAGTAGCVLAARLSEESERTVCLLEAGPDYGPRAEGRWPADILDPRALAFSHDWGVGGEDDRSLGARIVGGSSAHNACMVIWGAPSDYDEWGGEWSFASFAPYLDRATACMCTTGANTDRPAPPHDAFVEAARQAGLPLLDAPNDPAQPVGVARLPANVVGGVRWSAAFSYLEPARGRDNLTVLGDTLVDRLVIDGGRCVGVQTADGQRIEAATVVLAAGAYFSPAILMRSGVGPASDLRRLGVEPVPTSPSASACSTITARRWAGSPRRRSTRRAPHTSPPPGRCSSRTRSSRLPAASCAPGTWDLMLLSWVTPPTDDAARYAFTVGVFHMKPSSHGRLRLRSVDPRELPIVERGFFTDPADLPVVVEGIELARAIAGNEPLRRLLGTELRPGSRDLERVRACNRAQLLPPRRDLRHRARRRPVRPRPRPRGPRRGRCLRDADHPPREHEPDGRCYRREDRRDTLTSALP